MPIKKDPGAGKSGKGGYAGTQAQPVTFEILIKTDGTITATTLGIDGPACSIESKFLDALGDVVVDSPTAEFYKDGPGEDKAILRAGR